MAAGTPILTSNRSALPEVAGDAAILVDPENVAQMASELRRLADDLNLRVEMTRRGVERTRLFTWEGAVRRTWDVYQHLLR
jgi:glycosyltransferase involved in cell wall biosynthesis